MQNEDLKQNIQITESVEKNGKISHITKGAYDLSLGISMVIAILIGLGIGYGLYKLTDFKWFILIGLIYGFMAAILNVYKAYKRLRKDFKDIEKDVKYNYKKDV